MTNMRKGQGLPLNVVILAIIALIVLAILFFILAKNAGFFETNLNDCQSKGGVCVKDAPDGKCPANKTAIIVTPACARAGEKTGNCCINPLG